MPSTATITAFYTFSANTKARASQVNTNFSAFRGHMFAIDPNTIAGANNTYDLGSTEYRWREGYFRSIDLLSTTTTGAALSMSGVTTGAGAGFVFKIAGTEAMRIVPIVAATTAADIHGIAASSIGNFTGNTAATQTVTNSTVTLVTLGQPVWIGLVGDVNPGGSSGVTIQNNFASDSLNGLGTIEFNVDGVTAACYHYQVSGYALTGTAYNTATHQLKAPFPSTVIPLAAGTHTIYCRTVISGSGPRANLILNYARILAYEMR